MPSQSSFQIRNVALFDGERLMPGAAVVVENGTVIACGAGEHVHTEPDPFDGTGMTLLPGLIDCHVHAWGPVEKVLKRALRFGVTTELEMECDGDGLAEVRQIKAADPDDLAQIRSSGFPVTVPGGHGTEYGFPVPTVANADDVQSFVDARIGEGSDYIKIIYGDERRGMPVMNNEILRAAVEAAHRRGQQVVVHIESRRTAREAIEAGADCLGHVFGDEVDEEIGWFVAQHRAFVIPTLSVVAGAVPTGVSLLTDEHLAPYLSDFDRRQLARTMASLNEELGRPQRPLDAHRRSRARANVSSLFEAGVPILAGTDAPNPGTTHGASIHRELELLVEAGLPPAQVLAAATSLPARLFGLRDRGRIAPGLRADLLLVNGDPTSDITATRDIVAVWKAGVRVERAPRQPVGV